MLTFSISLRVAFTISKIRTCNLPWLIQPQRLAWWRFNNFNFLWGCNPSCNLAIFIGGDGPSLLYISGIDICPESIRAWSYHLGHRQIRRSQHYRLWRWSLNHPGWIVIYGKTVPLNKLVWHRNHSSGTQKCIVTFKPTVYPVEIAMVEL